MVLVLVLRSRDSLQEVLFEMEELQEVLFEMVELQEAPCAFLQEERREVPASLSILGRMVHPS